MGAQFNNLINDIQSGALRLEQMSISKNSIGPSMVVQLILFPCIYPHKKQEPDLRNVTPETLQIEGGSE
jgi:hypothetical protein